MDYNWSDSSVIKMMKEAKGLLDPYATSAEIMHLTRCIMEDKAEVITNVNHVVRSLVERSVFEFTKLRIASEWSVRPVRILLVTSVSGRLAPESGIIYRTSIVTRYYESFFFLKTIFRRVSH